MIPRILGIAPYENMRLLLTQLAMSRSDIELTVTMGDLEAGAAIASAFTTRDYDMIISRGGTAELIREVTNIPVLDVTPTVYDLLRAILMAKSTTNRYAIIGFSNITKNASLLSDLMQYDIETFTIHSLEEAEQVLDGFSSTAYDLILCDSVTYTLASRYPLNFILITSGIESLTAALDQAVQYVNIYHSSLFRSQLYQLLLEQNTHEIYVFSAGQELVYYTSQALYSHEFVDSLKALIPTVTAVPRKLYRRRQGAMLSIQAVRQELQKETFYLFYINSRKIPLAMTKSGILYLNRNDVEAEPANGFYRLLLNCAPVKNIFAQFSSSALPFVLTGEAGCAETELIKAFYAQGALQDNPLVIIDCTRISHEKNWLYLMEDVNSPLSDTNTTIYFRNIEFLNESSFTELLDTICDVNLKQRNRLLFSFTGSQEKSRSPYFQILCNRLGCLNAALPPIRECPEALPHILSLGINHLNLKLAKAVIGFDQASMAYLKEHNWPFNYEQLDRMLHLLVSQASGPYIREAEVREFLAQESLPLSSAPANSRPALEGTLEEITLDIVTQVLEQENGNHSAAAKRLGIGRSTLWRMLQRV